MSTDRERTIARAELAQRESKQLDFKREFDTASNEAWCEVIKDIVAFANSGGGIILFGPENNGTDAGVNCSSLIEYDIADITNKIFKYTGNQFADLEIVEVARSGRHYPAFLISRSDVPIIFTRPGTYDAGGGKQKTAFSQGTVYFRHGGKSEPGDQDDLIAWRDRELANLRRSMLQGMRKVVEAPMGHTVSILPTEMTLGAQSGTFEARITDNPDAPAISIRNTAELYPHRQKDLLKAINDSLPTGRRVNSHDLRCVSLKIDLLKTHPEFAHKPHRLASPQYSERYVEWIAAQVAQNPDFFDQCRQEFRTRN